MTRILAALAAQCLLVAVAWAQQPADLPRGWQPTGLTVEEGELYWSESFSRRRDVPGADEVLLAELVKLARPGRAQYGYRVYGYSTIRRYHCVSGAYRTEKMYLILEPEVLDPAAKAGAYVPDPRSPRAGGTLPDGSPHRRFVDAWCARKPAS